jgi:hypothetical protein
MASALFSPWPGSSIRLAGIVRLRLVLGGNTRLWCALVIIFRNIRRGGLLCHQVPATGIVKHQNRFASLLHLGMEGPRSPSISQRLQLSPNGSYASERSWPDGDGGKAYSRNFQRWRLLFFASLILPHWPSSALHSSSLLSTVNVHADFGSGGPR